jgi:hypothetical protein
MKMRPRGINSLRPFSGGARSLATKRRRRMMIFGKTGVEKPHGNPKPYAFQTIMIPRTTGR